ncbi:hypothetical protein AURDEDRAFT_178002 [Auricularia subglabra TFB-10046 SS5]|uniref:Uncharacterized protein n=1 Tax=Auricularia subglabra (strain TFB-10046 / SS5) TaxID=717982 RepID=J0CRL2_AURST|nr:hypothetical protein AURDEDRAFT_178002 [Auricularia subglabra TFB-10046 SS5]
MVYMHPTPLIPLLIRNSFCPRVVHLLRGPAPGCRGLYMWRATSSTFVHPAQCSQRVMGERSPHSPHERSPFRTLRDAKRSERATVRNGSRIGLMVNPPLWRQTLQVISALEVAHDVVSVFTPRGGYEYNWKDGLRVTAPTASACSAEHTPSHHS